MKYLILLFISCQSLIYAQIPYPSTPIYVDASQPWTNGTINISNVDNVVYYNSTTLNAKVDIKAAKEILLQPNAIAANFNNPGSFTAEIKQSYLNPVAFQSPLGYNVQWNSIYRFDRFEVGVQLPPSTNQLIEDFLNGNNSGINPYDQDQIKLVGTYTQSNGLNQIRYGFYYRDITLVGNSYTQQQSTYPFRIRFAPPNTGDYRLQLELYIAGNKVDETYCSFTVTDNSKNGFWSLNSLGKLTDSRSHEVFALGQNIPFANPCGNQQNDCNQAFNDQRGYIQDLADNHGNLARIRLDPWSNEIEWEELGVYGSNRTSSENFRRQYHAYQLDQTFDLCESMGVYVFLTLMQDQTLTHAIPYGSGSEWPRSPYSSVIANPQDFLTDPIAKAAFKHKLDYIISRWGYSANLGMYSIFNEANGIENWKTSGSVRTDMMNWHCEMSSYLKNRAPRHLITTGYNSGGTAKTNTVIKEDNTFSCGSIDIASCNHYSTSRDLHQERHDDLPKRVSNNWNSTIHTNIKPFIFGEIGMTDCNPATDEFTDAEFHNSIWSTSMYDGAIGNGLYWYGWEQKGPGGPINHRKNFKALWNFTLDLNLSTDSYVSKWDFSGSSLKKNRKMEYIESRNTGRAKGYGWVKNADYFWINDPYLLSSLPSNNVTSSKCNESGSTKYSFAQHNENIFIHGLQGAKRYNINFWSCYNSGGPNGGSATNIWTNVFGTLFFRNIVSTGPGINGDPDFAYKLARITTNFRTAQDTVGSSDTLFLYKDRNCFEASGYQDDAQENTHFWNFGNGKTSNEMDPWVCYDKAGQYHVRHTYKDTTNNIISITQTVVIIFQEENIISETYMKNNNLLIFPNPTNSSVYIKSIENISDIWIYNQLGELIINLSNINKSEFEINEIKDIKSGTYFVRVSYFSGGIDYRKFIKM